MRQRHGVITHGGETRLHSREPLVDERAHDAHAEPGAGDRARLGGGAAEIRLEDALEFAGLHAHARIGDAQYRLVGGGGMRPLVGGDTEDLDGGRTRGPGNALMDHWCQHHTGQPFDRDGAWAASGQVLPGLLTLFNEEPYLHRAPPKSTGRDLFRPEWLQERLARFGPATPADVQATLTELTASACAESASSYRNNSSFLAVCGGGAFNRYLMARLQALLPTLQVQATDAFGLPALQVEAAAFAWLGRQAVLGLPGNLPMATGAQGARVLGCIYPA